MNSVGKSCWVWEMFWKRVGSSGAVFQGSLLKLAGVFLLVIISLYYLKLMSKLHLTEKCIHLCWNFSCNLKKKKTNPKRTQPNKKTTEFLYSFHRPLIRYLWIISISLFSPCCKIKWCEIYQTVLKVKCKCCILLLAMK